MRQQMAQQIDPVRILQPQPPFEQEQRQFERDSVKPNGVGGEERGGVSPDEGKICFSYNP